MKLLPYPVPRGLRNLLLMEGIAETNVESALAFKVVHTTAYGAERCGSFQFGTKSLQTPALLVHTRYGSPQYMPPDLADKLSELKAVHINAKDFVMQGDVFEKYGLGGHKYLVMGEKILCLSYHDPGEFDASPVLAKSLNMSALGGKRKIDAAGWVKLQSSFRAELYTAMSFDVQFHAGNKRLSKCVDATIAWLDELLPSHSDNKTSVYHADAPMCAGAMFAVIQGGNNEFERRRCAKAVTERISRYAPSLPIQGFVFGGFGLDELPEERSHAIQLTTSLLPDHLPRLLPSVDTPEDILEAVSLGIDLFSNSYPARIAELGHALIFAYDHLDNPVADSQRTVPITMGGDRNKLNLKDNFYELDTDPLLKGCTCYTCTKHTRAYLHHLINTHELLSTILLVIHNTHHYLAFFAAIRDSIQQNRLKDYRTAFTECYRRPLLIPHS